jgi:hypothetical protein
VCLRASQDALEKSKYFAHVISGCVLPHTDQEKKLNSSYCSGFMPHLRSVRSICSYKKKQKQNTIGHLKIKITNLKELKISNI